MADYILIGTIGNPLGYSGEFVVLSPQKSIEALPKNLPIKVGFSENFAKNYKLEIYDLKANGKLIAKLAEVNSKEEIANFKEQGIFATNDDVKKYNPDYRSTDDIIGCRVIVESDGSVIGEVVEVWELPANDVWLVATDKGELPLPAIDDVLLECDFKNKRIKINLLDGLLDLIDLQGKPDED